MAKSVDQLRILGTVARGDVSPKLDNETTLSNYWINKSEDILNDTKGMDSIERALTWERETEEWAGWSGNKDYYWSTKYSLSPETDNRAKQQHTDSVVNDLIEMGDEQREFYFRDNAYKLPSHLFKHLEPLFDTTNDKLTQKQIERSRINQSFEVTNLLESKDLSNLSPDVSDESHANSIRKAIINGYTEFFVDDQGFIAIPSEGKVLRAVNLQDSENITDSLTSQIDWMPSIFRAVGKSQTKSRQDIVDSDIDVLRGLRLNLGNKNIRREHKKSIIVDYALTVSTNPMRDIREDIQTVLGQDITEGKYKSMKELANALFRYQKDIWETLSQRT